MAPPGQTNGRSGSRTAFALVATAPLVALLLPWAASGEPGALALLAGRLHPLLVHFPIALLLAAAALELLAGRVPSPRVARSAAAGLLAAGTWAALAAVLTGLRLAREGGYDPSLLSRHRWLGLAVAAVAVTAVVAKKRLPEAQARRALVPGSVLLVVLIVAAGHDGGALAHGAAFLTRDLPGPLGRWLGSSAVRGVVADPARTRVYAALIQPIFDRRCVECHGEARRRGGLVLETPEGLSKGGDGGAVLLAGRPDASEIVRRTEAAPWNPDVMPPDGRAPLAVADTELLRAWIATGASFDQTLADLAAERLPSAVETRLRRILPEGASRGDPLEAIDAPAADPAAVAAARAAGFEVRNLSRDSPLLEVQAAHLGTACGDEELEALRGLAPQLAWLNLARTGITDAGLGVVAALPHLTRVDLGATGVGDAGVARLAGLEHLEVLNLHATGVSDASLETLAGLPGLERVYLWSTAVTAEGAERLRERRPDLEVDRGVTPLEGES